jgi:hypothetical protein
MGLERVDGASDCMLLVGRNPRLTLHPSQSRTKVKMMMPTWCLVPTKQAILLPAFPPWSAS